MVKIYCNFHTLFEYMMLKKKKFQKISDIFVLSIWFYQVIMFNLFDM